MARIDIKEEDFAKTKAALAEAGIILYNRRHRKGGYICRASGRLAMKLLGTTHPLFDDSRGPQPLETVPTEFIAHPKKKGKNMKKLLIMTVIVTSVVMVSCNVTRTITNESQYYQRGDTSVVIQTKTIETYDASRKL